MIYYQINGAFTVQEEIIFIKQESHIFFHTLTKGTKVFIKSEGRFEYRYLVASYVMSKLRAKCKTAINLKFTNYESVRPLLDYLRCIPELIRWQTIPISDSPALL